jgi:hypothetical protein
VTHKLTIAFVIGIAFLASGVTMVLSLPSPIWFDALDLIGAYLPMAYLDHKLVTKNAEPKSEHAQQNCYYIAIVNGYLPNMLSTINAG